MPEAYAASIERLRTVAGTARDPDGHVFAVIAEYLRRDGRLAEARAVLDEGRAAAPDFASGHLVAVHVLSELGDLEGAREALTRVHELDRENTRAPELGQALSAAEEAAALDWARAQGVGPAVEVDDEVVTVTLGALYLEQGATERAEEVARQLLAEDSANASAQALLERARAGQPGAVDEAETPDELSSAGESEAAGAEPDSEIDGALELEGAGVDVPSLDVAELAPDPTDVAELAPDPMDVAELAPDPVPIGDLAPDAVPVATLAPDIVPVASLAPTGVPIESLAPDSASVTEAAAPSAERADGEDAEDLDDFMSWLGDH